MSLKKLTASFCIGLILLQFTPLSVFTVSAGALPTDTWATSTGPVNIKSIIGKNARDPINTRNLADLFSGAATYNYGISMPKGPRELTPDVSIGYSSQSKDNSTLCGYGWSCSMPSITRTTRYGTDQIYQRDEYVFQWQEYVSVGNSTYKPKVSSQDSSILKTSEGFVFVDVSGVKRYFGTTAVSRLANPEVPSQVFAWYIDKIELPTGEKIEYGYENDSKNVYPKYIRYGFSADTAYLYEVKYSYVPKARVGSSYRTNFLTQTRQLVSEIALYVNHEKTHWYKLEYTNSDTTDVFLSSIQELAIDVVLPKTTFTYGKGPEIQLLKSIDTSVGGSTEFEYSTSATLRNSAGKLANPNLPMNMMVVVKSTSKDIVNGAQYVQQYSYEDGYYYTSQADPYRREYAGFGTARIKEPGIRESVYEYYQGRPKTDDYFEIKGRVKSTSMYDNTGKLMNNSATVYDVTDLDNGRKLVVTSDEISREFSATGAFFATASHADYDALGRMTTKKEFGLVNATATGTTYSDIGTDLRETRVSYANTSGKNIRNLPREQTFYSHSEAVIGYVRNYYDNSALGEVGDYGLVTKVEREVLGEGRYIANVLEYDAKRMPIRMIDPMNVATTYAYDAYGIAMTKITNAKGWDTLSGYDYRTGQSNSQTDPNGLHVETNFDGLGRPVSEAIRAGTGNLIPLKTWSYNDTTIPLSVTVTKKSQFGDRQQIVYLDGFGRGMQIKEEAFETGKWWTRDVEYNQDNKPVYQSLPYVSSTFAYSSPDDVGGVSWSYDATGRMVRQADSTGESTTSYGLLSVMDTDKKGNKKGLRFDTAGNLTNVVEYLNNSELVTSYEYSPTGKLIRMTDALGNTRTLSYDGLDRLRSMEDLHTPTAFATSKIYEYNNNSQITKRTNQAGEWLENAYDELGRTMEQKFYRTNGSIERTNNYEYDTGTNALGKLTRESNVNYSRNFAYDAYGQKISETTIVSSSGIQYVNTYSYVPTGEISGTTYPDGFSIGYEYQKGFLKAVNSQSGSIAQIDSYSSVGKPSKISYGDHLSSEFTYDPDSLYRLTRNVVKRDAETLQNLTYTYDAEGNISHLADSSGGVLAHSANYEYDDLSRMTAASVTSGSGASIFTASYGYDAVGNRLTWPRGVAVIGGTTGLAPGVGSSNVYRTSHDGTYGYEYDAKGNMTRMQKVGEDRSFLYDSDDRLIRSSNAGTTDFSYTYDVRDIRLSKKDVAEKSMTYYPSDLFETEIDKDTLGDGTVVKTTTTDRFIYLGSERIATLQSVNQEVISNYSQSVVTVPVEAVSGSGTSSESSSGATESSGSGSIESASSATTTVFLEFRIASAEDTGSGSLDSGNLSTGYGSEMETQSGSGVELSGSGLAVTNSGSRAEINTPPTITQTTNAPVNSTRLIYLLQNHITSVGLRMESTGAILGGSLYAPFGETIVEYDGESTPQVSVKHKNRYGFSGKEKDKESNMHYFEARYYGDGLGRFSSVDPVFFEVGVTERGMYALEYPQSFHPYSYARNNPMRWVDPTGEYSWNEFKSDAAAIKDKATNLKDKATDLAAKWAEKIDEALSVPRAYAPEYGAAPGPAPMDAFDAMVEYGGYLFLAKWAIKIWVKSIIKSEVKAWVRVTIGRATRFELPKNAAETFSKYEKKGWQNIGDRTGWRAWWNTKSQLPTDTKYREFDVNIKTGPTRDTERFVRWDNWKTYYTDDHYETFVLIE